MQFAKVLAFVSIMVATVSATPSLYPRACSPGGCVAALAATFAACGAAAAEDGLNPFADAACFAAAADTDVNIDECTDCF